jgi:hypothetical protein
MLKYFLMSAFLAAIAVTVTYSYYASTFSFRHRHRTLAVLIGPIITFGSAFIGIRLMSAFFRQQGMILSHIQASLVMLTFAIVWAAGCAFTALRIHRKQAARRHENI